jgi:PAS domain S-box-containing protein
MGNPLVLLTIDDDEAMRRSVRGYFEDFDFRVLEAEDGKTGLDVFRNEGPDVVLVDLRMPGLSGLEVIQAIAEEAPEVPLVVLSGTGVIGDAIDAIRKGAWDFVTKPIVEMAQLQHVVSIVLERARLRSESSRYRQHLEEEVARRTRELTEINNRLKAIVQSTRTVASCTTIQEVSSRLLEEFASNMAAEGGSIYLVEDGKLVLKYCLDEAHTAEQIPLPPCEDSPIHKALETRQPLVIRDLSAEVEIRPSGWSGYRDPSLLIFPLLDDRNEPIGVITLHNKTNPPFTEQDREIGVILSSYSWEAIRASRAIEALRESEERFKRLLQNSNDIITVTDEKGIQNSISGPIERILGYKPEELIGTSGFEIIHPEDIEHTMRAFAEGVKHPGSVGRAEYRCRHKDGSWIALEAAGTNLLHDPIVKGVVLNIRDISERKKAEQAVEKALERSRLQLETVSEIAVSSALVSGQVSALAAQLTELGAHTLGVERVGVWLFTDAGETLTCVDLYESTPGTHSTGIALKRDQFHNEFDALATARYIDADDALTDPRTVGYINDYIKPLRITSMLDAVIRTAGENLGVVCFERVDNPHHWQPDEIAFACQVADQFAIALHNRDKRMADHALRESEKKYRFLAENVSDVIFTMNLDLRLTYVSPAVERMHGWKSGELLSFKPSDYLTPSSLELIKKILTEELAVQGSSETDPNRVRTFELEQYRNDGAIFWTEVSTRFLYDETGSTVGIIGAIRDVSERKRSEAELKRLFTAVEQAGESILITDPKGEILYANPAFESTTGYSVAEVIGKTANILNSGKQDEAVYEDMWSTIRRGQVWRGRFVNKKKDGSLYHETATISPMKDDAARVVNYVMVGRDVTSEIMLQKQLLQSQKMEAIGTLAGGIAHDFNNLLQAVLGCTDLLLMRRKADDPDRQKLEIIHHAAKDGADLISRILTFSRKAEAKTRPIDLNEEIRKAERLLRRTVPKMIEIKLALKDGVRVIDADPAQIEQVLLNLAVNAQHAMPEGGRIVIETSNAPLSDAYARAHIGAKPGQYVLLAVSDNGIGIRPEFIDRVFEPFFTTKAEGEGTGLGLSMVHGIVSQHGGHIRCYSEPDAGTSFKIYFPVSSTELLLDEFETREMPAFGTETILLIDDDDRVREMAREMIQEHGYKVLMARSGEDALEIYAGDKDDISLVILDLIMPGMGGKKCLKELLRIDPNVRVLIASGYSSDGLAKDEKRSEAKGFVNKPYDAKAILSAIRKVLDHGHM